MGSGGLIEYRKWSLGISGVCGRVHLGVPHVVISRQVLVCCRGGEAQVPKEDAVLSLHIQPAHRRAWGLQNTQHRGCCRTWAAAPPCCLPACFRRSSPAATLKVLRGGHLAQWSRHPCATLPSSGDDLDSPWRPGVPAASFGPDQGHCRHYQPSEKLVFGLAVCTSPPGS